jgi:PAS domain S-box-containing protein
VNKAWCEFTGRVREDVIGQPARLFQNAADARLHDMHDRLLLAEGGRTQYEGGTLRRDGVRRDLSVTKAAVPGPDGQTTGILAVSMDLTEFRDAERATREARDAAEDASRTKSEFIANISHELRTPLQSILGFSELGRARSTEQAKLNLMFGDIHAAGQRMLALVNDLLDVAKIESAVGSMQPQALDVRPLVNDVVAELAPQLSQRQLQMDIRMSPEPLLAQVDPARLQQVLRNVLANAIRFSPLGAPLLVEGLIDPDTRIHLSVADQGPGIPQAELEKIFEAFVQSSKTKDGSGGTGLGLAISRKIAQAHGGEIRAENNASGGATFHVYLPTRQPEPGGGDA